MNDNTKARLTGILLSAAHKVGLFLAMTIICLPGLWIVVYTGMFAVFYLLDAYIGDATPAFWQRPWHTIGAGGLAGLSLVLTYDDFGDFFP